MHEDEMVFAMKSRGVDLVVSLPCDRNKGFTDLIHHEFEVIDVTREEDAVGICAGAFMAGRRPVISIQSSGLGNMMNAIMSLTDCYGLPMAILASWRGVDGEPIEAQIPFNSKVPELLDVYGIGHREVTDAADIPAVADAIDKAYSESRIEVVLIHPKMWEKSVRMNMEYPVREKEVSVSYRRKMTQPTLTRLQAIRTVMDCIHEDDIVVSNIGVPSKEVFASRDRPLNFYMLGSYTQATPIGLGLALSSERRVVVVDGDGSLLGSSIFPVLSSVHPDNLTVVCLDNGTFGSTGNQMNQAYLDVNLSAVATAYGLGNVIDADRESGITAAMNERNGMLFLRIPILPFNSDSKNIPYSAKEIKERFMGALRCPTGAS